MLFRRIAVRNFRKLLSPVVIEGLGDGITIVAGDNEEGKSTLLDAIRTCLFQRHTLSGEAVAEMQPFGSKVRPEIALDFEIDGKAYSVTKGFAQKESALLQTPHGIFEGQAAEERLAELLKFKVAQRGKSKRDDQGILGLFWLEQGRALAGLDFGETGRATLRWSLKDEVGDVLWGTRGRRLLEAARMKRDELLTAQRADPKGLLKEAIAYAEDARKRVNEYEKKRQEYDADIDELTRLRGELARIAGDRILEEAQDELDKVEERAKAIKELRRQDSEAGEAVELAEAKLENIQARCTRRKELIDALERKEGDLKSAQETLENLEAESVDVASKCGAAEEALSRARLEVLGEEIADLRQRLQEVDTLEAQQAEAQKCLSGITVDKRSFEHIETSERDIGEARAALGAIATRVRFFPSACQVIRKADEEVQAGEEIQLTEAARFTLEGFGAIEVAPGASDLVERRERLKEAEDALNKALIAAGVQTVAQARSQLVARTEAETAVKGAEHLIAAHAPNGIEALRNAHMEKASERDRLAESFDPSLIPDLGGPETGRRALASTKSVEKTAREAREAAQNKQQEHKTELAVAEDRLAVTKEDTRAAKGDLEAARVETSDGALSAGLEQAGDILAERKLRKVETERQLAEANPDETELRRRRAAETLRTVTDEQTRFRDDAIRIEGRLTALGQSGFGELLDEARGAKDQAIASRNRLQAEAKAWDLLVTALSEAELEAKDAFLEPVLKRVEPFLQLLQPGTLIELDKEKLEIISVARDGRVEPYETLSGGMREQLSILVRLAFAVYLREKGYPAAVILDDAPVYTDPDRFERMQRALLKAAETVQILILTCNPAHWRQIGAPVRRLTDGRINPSSGFPEVAGR